MLVFAILVGTIWLYLLIFHGTFWRIDRAQLPAVRSSRSTVVAVVVPARNEADVIARAVSSLVRQDFNGELHLFVVDDNSTDSTANIARAAAGKLEAANKLQVIQGSPLPTGWTGKVWAMQQGWQAAREVHPGYVLLTDADIEHAPDHLSRLIAQAENGRYGLVSLMVRLHCETLAEKFLIPAFVYFFFLLYPPARIANSQSRVAGAAGGCMLVRPEALNNIGGMESIRGEIIDDCALAIKIKDSGERLWLGVTRQTRSLRTYRGLGEIRHMIARTAFNQLRHSAFLLVGCIAGMLLTFAGPLALMWSNNKTVEWIGLGACLMMFATYVPILRLYRVSILSAVTLPFAAVFYMYATILSAWNYWRHEGGEWKGRAQDSMKHFS